jgi:hypothetical protein
MSRSCVSICSRTRFYRPCDWAKSPMQQVGVQVRCGVRSEGLWNSSDSIVVRADDPLPVDVRKAMSFAQGVSALATEMELEPCARGSVNAR